MSETTATAVRMLDEALRYWKDEAVKARAEVARLRADLADARRNVDYWRLQSGRQAGRIDAAFLALDAWGPIEDADEDVQAVYRALSAGGGGPAGDSSLLAWGEHLIAESGRDADTEGRQG